MKLAIACVLAAGCGVAEGSQVDRQSSGNAPPDDVSYDGTATFTVHPL